MGEHTKPMGNHFKPILAGWYKSKGGQMFKVTRFIPTHDNEYSRYSFISDCSYLGDNNVLDILYGSIKSNKDN